MLLLKRILNKLKFIVFYNKTINGKSIKIPIYNTVGFANFTHHEPFMDEVLIKLGSDKSKMLDVGVNVGQTLLKWKTLFPNAEYRGVEPNTTCIYYVDLLIKKNNFSNCILFPVGLSNVTGAQYLYVQSNDDSDIAGTTVKDFRENVKVKQLAIPTFKYKDLFSKDEGFDVIKIDVEGAELYVLETIFPIKTNVKPKIVCEILPAYNSDNKVRIDRQNNIFKLLADNNYKIFSIERVTPVKLVELTEFGIHGDLNKCEYLFVHESEVTEILEKFEH